MAFTRCEICGEYTQDCTCPICPVCSAYGCNNPNHDKPCLDCESSAKHSYSDATTPGFFHSKCKLHR